MATSGMLRLSAVSGALLAACGSLLGVEPLSGEDAGVDASTGVVADAGGLDAGATDAPTTPLDSPSASRECGLAWVDASGGVVPAGAVVNEPSGKIYVCHASTGTEVVPGKLLPGYGCYYGDGDAEVLTVDYQVLVPNGCLLDWRPAPGGVVSGSAFPCGTESNGDPYWSCRATAPDTPDTYIDELGHMGWETNHLCVYSYGGASLSTDTFDVLTLGDSDGGSE